MSRRVSKGVKRPRQQQGKEEDAQPAPLHLTAHPTLPLLLLALSVAQSYLGMCISAQLCDAQGAALFPFVCLPPRVRRPLAGAPVHDMSLTHGERLRVVQKPAASWGHVPLRHRKPFSHLHEKCNT